MQAKYDDDHNNIRSRDKSIQSGWEVLWLGLRLGARSSIIFIHLSTIFMSGCDGQVTGDGVNLPHLK